MWSHPNGGSRYLDAVQPMTSPTINKQPAYCIITSSVDQSKRRRRRETNRGWCPSHRKCFFYPGFRHNLSRYVLSERLCINHGRTILRSTPTVATSYRYTPESYLLVYVSYHAHTPVNLDFVWLLYSCLRPTSLFLHLVLHRPTPPTSSRRENLHDLCARVAQCVVAGHIPRQRHHTPTQGCGSSRLSATVPGTPLRIHAISNLATVLSAYTCGSTANCSWSVRPF